MRTTGFRQGNRKLKNPLSTLKGHSRHQIGRREAVAGAGVYICGTHDGFESTRAGRLADCGCREQSPARAASKLTLSIAAIGQESP
jgi:hypothetical protein